MQFQRAVSAILVLATLLSGAWMPVHVGWHATVNVAPHSGGEVGLDSKSSCGCCSHSCEEKGQDQGSDSPGQQEHDSDTCRICQAFYLSRVAELPTTGCLEDDGETLLESVIYPYVNSSTAQTSSFLSRGPPLGC